MKLEEALQKYFHYTHFRPGQKEVITSLLNGEDTLAVLPTGTGKSLCYQLTGYLQSGLVVIVSPLISLMEDQVTSFLRAGEKRVAALNGTLQAEEKKFILAHLSAYKFLFLSPEMLLQEAVLATLSREKIGLLVIDEAHCVSQWGIDFRPEYRNLDEAKRRLHSPLTLALTASATEKVREEIKTLLLSPKQAEWIYSMNRPNIALLVEQSDDKLINLKQALRQQAGSGIIYCATRKKVEELYEELQGEFSVGYYHGGLESNQRRMLQQQFLANELQFLIATNAFGMGINKPDIRLVVHYELPDNLENYMQEIGRAGRDGQQSYGLLLYQEGDERIHHFLQNTAQAEREAFELKLSYQAIASLTDLQEKWWQQTKKEGAELFLHHLKANEYEKKEKLAKMLAYVRYDGCRRAFLLKYFEETLIEEQDQCCDFHGCHLPERVVGSWDSPTFASWQSILIKMFKENF
ncbi:RecQ family ATP-dependent DNA helicase [Candidatus Enterococcus willemsii]|uniref:ATP-dependent DNA helicase RecQ n=1 Tax=Candidatus Enterococcus willemsii TaxID=1857215 RepID=A0ABQ6YVG5_9ENTE|nr:ATP-dependent DNA helicase RecQ [Enterococcus sp. CU12B]KAF1301082.1 recombinase RecQ [Enterococcus sp. CU12B]